MEVSIKCPSQADFDATWEDIPVRFCLFFPCDKSLQALKESPRLAS